MTRLGALMSDLNAGREVLCTEAEMYRLCHDLARERPRRSIRAIPAGGLFACQVVGRANGTTEVRR